MYLFTFWEGFRAHVFPKISEERIIVSPLLSGYDATGDIKTVNFSNDF